MNNAFGEASGYTCILARPPPPVKIKHANVTARVGDSVTHPRHGGSVPPPPFPSQKGDTMFTTIEYGHKPPTVVRIGIAVEILTWPA